MKKKILLLLTVCLFASTSFADRRIDLECQQAKIIPTSIIINPPKPTINADDHVIANIDDDNTIKLDFLQAAGKTVTVAVFDLTTGGVVYNATKVAGTQDSFDLDECESGLYMLMISYDGLYFDGTFDIIE